MITGVEAGNDTAPGLDEGVRGVCVEYEVVNSVKISFEVVAIGVKSVPETGIDIGTEEIIFVEAVASAVMGRDLKVGLSLGLGLMVDLCLTSLEVWMGLKVGNKAVVDVEAKAVSGKGTEVGIEVVMDVEDGGLGLMVWIGFKVGSEAVETKTGPGKEVVVESGVMLIDEDSCREGVGVEGMSAVVSVKIIASVAVAYLTDEVVEGVDLRCEVIIGIEISCDVEMCLRVEVITGIIVEVEVMTGVEVEGKTVAGIVVDGIVVTGVIVEGEVMTGVEVEGKTVTGIVVDGIVVAGVVV